MKRIALSVFVIFFAFFIFKSADSMYRIPLHDFDEANRAEGARNMKLFKSYLAPITGSPFLRKENLFVIFPDNPRLLLYHHLERPPFYFLSMVASTNLLGDNEFAYRAPSLLFGLLAVAVLALFFSFPVIPLTAFITSSDWWLSSQSALIDTSLAFFLFLSFIFLLKFTEGKKTSSLILSGLSLGAAILSKGQPAVIMSFPILFMLLTRKINFKQLIILAASTIAVVAPWIFLTVKKFGLENFLDVFFAFARDRATVTDATQSAPIFWYARWWIESNRLGWLLFLSLAIYDAARKKLTYGKILTLFYFSASFIFFSLSRNKVWWYVLPLVPVAALYIFQSLSSLLKDEKQKIFNISLIVSLFSLPVFYGSSNTVALLYAALAVAVSQIVLNFKFNFSKKINNVSAILAVIFALSVFCFRFPTVLPTYPESKPMGEYYQYLPHPKCLYLKNMPYESILFYSRSGEIKYLEDGSVLNPTCNNYIITPDAVDLLEKIYENNRLKIYRL